jgi:purine-binding chemotaxis protein CheW
VVGLIVDIVNGVIELPRDDLMVANRILPNLEYVEGVAKLDDGLVLIHDLDTFLSAVEEQQLDGAMTE